MGPEMSVGRKVGILLLAQMASALIFPFVLMDAVRKGYPGFLETAAASGFQIRAGVVLAFFGAALTLVLAIKMFPVLRRHSFAAASALFVVCVISAALDAVHNGSILVMLSASEQYATGGVDGAVIQAWGAMAAATRRSVHIIQLVAIGAWMATFYFTIWRFRLIPRPLAALGLLGVASQFSGVTVMMFLGAPPLGYLAMPLAPIHAITAIWLIVKGLPPALDKQSPSRLADD
jgi:hypothetical protein